MSPQNPWLTATLEAFEAREATSRRTDLGDWWEIYSIAGMGAGPALTIERDGADEVETPSLRRRDVTGLLPSRGFAPSFSPAGGGDMSMDSGSYSNNWRGENYTWNGGVNHQQNHVWNGDINITETVIYEGDIDLNITHRIDVSDTIDLVFDWTGQGADPVTEFNYEAPQAGDWDVSYRGGDVITDAFTARSGHPQINMEAAYAQDGADSLITQGQELAFVLASREALADMSIVGDNYLGSQVTEVTAAEGYVSAGISNQVIDQWQHNTLGGAQFGGSTPVLGALVDVTTGDVLAVDSQVNT